MVVGAEMEKPEICVDCTSVSCVPALPALNDDVAYNCEEVAIVNVLDAEFTICVP